MTLNELCIQIEALNIVKKKNSDYIPDELSIGKWKVVKSGHQKESRPGEILPRDYGLSNNELYRIMKLFLEKNQPEHGKEYHLFYKPNKNEDNYNDIVVLVVGNLIKIKTVIQKEQKFSKYRVAKEDKVIVLENYLIFID